MTHVHEIPNLIYFAIPFFVITLIMEAIITSKKNMNSYTLKDAFSGNISLSDRISYFFKPPGWKPNGKGVLSSDLRKDWERKL